MVIYMNLNQLYYFQTLAKYQHYTKASQELYISQPSLTHAMKELEKELGVSLFIKKGRNVILSAAGELFLNYVNQSLAILEQGVNHVQNQYKDEQHVVEISVIPTIINTYLAPVLKEISTSHPEITVKFRSEKTLDIIQGVKHNHYDFGICSKIDDSSLTYLPITYEELVLITSLNHPLSQKEEISLQDIVQYPFITYQKNISIYHSIMQLFKEHQLQPHILYELDDETSIASMVSLDFGISIVANNDLLKPFHNIQIIHLNIKQDARTVYLVYNSSRKLSQTATQFIDYIISNHVQL